MVPQITSRDVSISETDDENKFQPAVIRLADAATRGQQLPTGNEVSSLSNKTSSPAVRGARLRVRGAESEAGQWGACAPS